MFNNLGVHLQKYPTGKYGYCGSLPYGLGNEAKPSREDIMAGRFTTNPDGETVTIKFPVFDTVQAAINHAENRGFDICQSKTCACHNLITAGR